MSDRHAHAEMTFTVSHEAWYWSALQRKEPQILVTMLAEGGGTTGEFTFTWPLIAGERTPKMALYDDAWSALVEIESRTDGRFLEGLEAMSGTKPPPEKIAKFLRGLGFRDATEREQGAS